MKIGLGPLRQLTQHEGIFLSIRVSARRHFVEAFYEKTESRVIGTCLPTIKIKTSDKLSVLAYLCTNFVTLPRVQRCSTFNFEGASDPPRYG